MVEGYTDGMLRYAITSGFDADLSEASIANARRWAEQGVDYVQLREKQLGAGELVRLAAAMRTMFRERGGQTKLLVNSRADIAVAAGADGVHLTSRPGELTAEQVRRVFAASGSGEPVVSVSCHTVAELQRAVAGRVDLILFGPVFEKRVGSEVVVAGVGLEALREACVIAGKTPVLALGGVTAENAEACVEAGAGGVAGIRLFGKPIRSEC
jgi:thiamine-phosphate pyrophosphorylase